MQKKRASAFDDIAADFDVSGFKPKSGAEPRAIPAEDVRAISEASNFPSRQSKKPDRAPAPPKAPEPPPKREPRRHRTGRTAQLNARTTQATVEAFYAIADEQKWLVGETIEHALAALQRELAAAKQSPKSQL